MNFNTKSNRKKLVRALFTVHRTRSVRSIILLCLSNVTLNILCRNSCRNFSKTVKFVIIWYYSYLSISLLIMYYFIPYLFVFVWVLTLPHDCIRNCFTWCVMHLCHDWNYFRYDLLPFYSRFVATLYPCMPDVAGDLVQLLKGDFKWHVSLFTL